MNLIGKVSLKGSFEKLGEVGICNIFKLRDFLTKFEADEIKIELKDNKLIITSQSSKDKLELILSEVKLLNNNLFNPISKNKQASAEKFEKSISSISNWFTLTKEDYKRVSAYFNAIKSENLFIKSENNSLVISTSEGSYKTLVVASDYKGEDIDTCFKKCLLTVFNCIGENVNITFLDDDAILNYETDIITAFYQVVSDTI